MVGTADMILDAAQRRVQSEGFHGFSFRDLAVDVGIRSASIHYYFPAKVDLTAALARRYTDRLMEALGSPASRPTAGAALKHYVSVFRDTLKQDGRMCLVGMLAAEIDTLPQAVCDEVARFVEQNTMWIAEVLCRTQDKHPQRRARAIFSALEGAMLIARGTRQIKLFDELVRTFIEAGLIPS